MKCKKACITKCISCSVCKGWVHDPCTKLNENELNRKYYFCSEKCKDIAIIPEGDEEHNFSVSQNVKKSQKPKKGDGNKSKNNNPFNSVNNHLLDVECSYLNPSDIDASILKNRNSEITIWQSNVRSLNANFNKIHEVFDNTENNLPDILAFTETWISDEASAPIIPGYSFECVNSEKTKNYAGGVGMYISNDFEYELQQGLSMKYKGCEDLWVKISNRCQAKNKRKSNGLIVGAIYRHPTQNYKLYLLTNCLKPLAVTVTANSLLLAVT